MMKRWEQWAFNVFHGIVAVTGVGYLITKHFMAGVDPFAVINHPWQPALLSLHVLAAPVFIAFFGMLFRSHTLQKLVSPNSGNRRTGWTSLISFSTMALTGYLLQVASNPAWLAGLVWGHVMSSLIFVTGYGVHLIIGWRLSQVSSITTDDLPRTARLPL